MSAPDVKDRASTAVALVLLGCLAALAVTATVAGCVALWNAIV